MTLQGAEMLEQGICHTVPDWLFTQGLYLAQVQLGQRRMVPQAGEAVSSPDIDSISSEVMH